MRGAPPACYDRGSVPGQARLFFVFPHGLTQVDPHPPRLARREALPPAPPGLGEREALVRAWLPRVYGAALALTRRVADAEDLTQEASLKAFRTPAGVRDEDTFGPWMLTILRNAWTDRVRRGRRERALDEPVQGRVRCS